MSDFAIQAEGLCRDFDGLRAVDHLDLEVPKGIIFGFLGPNGAGKTTTICLLLGLIKPTAGSARVLGFDVRREADRVRERVGALLENHGLYERLTARNNLDYFGEIYLLPTEERGARIEELLRHLGLWERRNEQVSRFSKEMKQKLAMARVRCTDRPWSSWTSPQRGWTRRALRPCGRTSRAWPAGRGALYSSPPTTWPRQRGSATWWGSSTKGSSSPGAPRRSCGGEPPPPGDKGPQLHTAGHCPALGPAGGGKSRIEGGPPGR